MARYNSAIFETLGSIRPDIFVVDEDFFLNGTWSTKFNYWLDDIHWVQNLTSGGAYKDTSYFQRLESKECARKYSTSNLSDADTLLVVVDQPPVELDTSLYGLWTVKTSLWSFQFLNSTDPNGSVFGSNSFPWSFGVEESVTYKSLFPTEHETYPWDQWAVAGYRVSHCISKKVDVSPCTLNFNMTILIVITTTNAVKALSMLLALPGAHSWSEPLVTFGDAVQSFLNLPDPTTEGNCLLGMGTEDSAIWGFMEPDEAVSWLPSWKRWGSAVNPALWGGVWFSFRESNPPHNIHRSH